MRAIVCVCARAFLHISETAIHRVSFTFALFPSVSCSSHSLIRPTHTLVVTAHSLTPSSLTRHSLTHQTPGILHARRLVRDPLPSSHAHVHKHTRRRHHLSYSNQIDFLVGGNRVCNWCPRWCRVGGKLFYCEATRSENK